MPFTQGIPIINILTADLSTNTDIIPNDITGFTFNLGAGKRLQWKLRGVMTTGATGGFRLVANSTVAATTYNAEWRAVDETTPATFQDAQIAQVDFTNASAVATNYVVEGKGEVTAAAATVFSIQFAQNNSTANNITMRAGMTLEIWQF